MFITLWLMMLSCVYDLKMGGFLLIVGVECFVLVFWFWLTFV